MFCPQKQIAKQVSSSHELMLLIIKALAGNHLVLPAQGTTCIGGLTAETSREEKKTRMGQMMDSLAQEQLHDINNYSTFMWLQKLSLSQYLLDIQYLYYFLIFRNFPQQVSHQALICTVCMIYQETSLKRDISLWHRIRSGK